MLDALGNQNFSNIEGLNCFYDEIIRQRERSVGLWQTDNRQFSILSYYLNQKIKELQLAFNNLLVEPPKVGGKIYDKQKNAFSNIYSDLICREEFSLN